MVTRADVVAEANEWMGTRWCHQGHSKGIGSDCGGMIYGVGFSLGIFPSIERLPEAQRFSGYGRRATNGSLVEASRLLLVEIEKSEAQPGDVVLMRFASEPQHLGILMPYHLGGLSMIHAYSRARAVVAHRLDDGWADRVTHAFMYPGIS